MVSLAVARNSLSLGWNIAADQEGVPLSNTDCLSSLANIVCILFKFFHFLCWVLCLLIELVSASANWPFSQSSSSSNCGILSKVLGSVVVAFCGPVKVSAGG